MKKIISIIIIISIAVTAWSQGIGLGIIPGAAYQNNSGLNLTLPDKGERHGRTLIGLTLGGSLAINQYDYGENGKEPPVGFLLLPSGGFTFDFESKGSFSFLMGLYLKGKGDKLNVDELIKGWTLPPEITVAGTGSISTSTYQLELPMAFCFNFGYPNRFVFGLGGYLGYGLWGKEKSNFSITYTQPESDPVTETINTTRDLTLVNFIVSEEIDSLLYINRVDYGLYGLVGFKLMPFAMNATLSWSMANQIPFKGSDLFESENSYQKVKGITPTLSVIYYFSQGRKVEREK
jgi:hypothetical protein